MPSLLFPRNSPEGVGVADLELGDGECGLEFEDSTDLLELEDGSGLLLLEVCVPAAATERPKRLQGPWPEVDYGVVRELHFRDSGAGVIALAGTGQDSFDRREVRLTGSGEESYTPPIVPTVHVDGATARIRLAGTGSNSGNHDGIGVGAIGLSGGGLDVYGVDHESVEVALEANREEELLVLLAL